jgi:hypothetical protein
MYYHCFITTSGNFTDVSTSTLTAAVTVTAADVTVSLLLL